MEMEREQELNRDSSPEVLVKSPEPGKERIVLKSSRDRAEVPAEPPKKVSRQGEELRPLSTVAADLAKRVRKTMTDIRSLGESSQGRFKDPAFGQMFQRSLAGHIDKSEADLDCFLEYLRIRSPVRQAIRVHVLLEEALEKRKKKLTEKGIRIFRKQFEKNLPDAGVHVEELRFILNWVLEYVILSTPRNQMIALLTRSLGAEEAHETIGSTQQREAHRVEIVIASGQYEEWNKHASDSPAARAVQNEGESSWMLSLVDEVVQKNRGSLQVSEGRLKMISLILPVERRSAVSYAQVPA
jgi:hypothetical protein